MQANNDRQPIKFKETFSRTIFEILLILSRLTILKADVSENRPTAVGFRQGATDGEQFVRRIVHGEKITDRPEFLIFTAPYRLCEGGCSNGKNFVLSFPIFIGKKGRKAYQSTYSRDALNIHSKRPNAPFKRRTTRPPMTTTSTCPTYTETTTVPSTTTVDVTTLVTTMTTETTTTEKIITTTEETTTDATTATHATTSETMEAEPISNDLFPVSEIVTEKIKRTKCKNYEGFCLKKIKKKPDKAEITDISDNDFNFTDSQDTSLDFLKPPKAFILIMLPILDAGDMPWHVWSWSAPQAPIEYFFRRHANMPIKNPNTKDECQCPPNKVCEVEFKMNEDMIDFLKIRGLLKKEEFEAYQKDIEDYRKSNGLSPKEYIKKHRFRRNMEDEEECCCPPRSVMMPTFITDKKFDEIVEKFDKKQVPPSKS